MRKSIAYIALIILLMAPVVTSISAAMSVGSENIAMAGQSPFSGDLEDQQDDPDPAKDGEVDQDADFLPVKESIPPIPFRLKETAAERQHLFVEHEREVGTPPPKG